VDGVEVVLLVQEQRAQLGPGAAALDGGGELRRRQALLKVRARFLMLLVLPLGLLLLLLLLLGLPLARRRLLLRPGPLSGRCAARKLVPAGAAAAAAVLRGALPSSRAWGGLARGRRCKAAAASACTGKARACCAAGARLLLLLLAPPPWLPSRAGATGAAGAGGRRRPGGGSSSLIRLQLVPPKAAAAAAAAAAGGGIVVAGQVCAVRQPVLRQLRRTHLVAGIRARPGRRRGKQTAHADPSCGPPACLRDGASGGARRTTQCTMHRSRVALG
jgi:hypothetical protein